MDNPRFLYEPLNEESTNDLCAAIMCAVTASAENPEVITAEWHDMYRALPKWKQKALKQIARYLRLILSDV